jgi:DNA-binding HxlR family transcriptional regulator
MSNKRLIDDSDSCPITQAMTMVGGKWKPIIIYVLSPSKLRFGQISFYIPGISRKVLTQQLRELEKDELVTRTVYPEVPPRVEYDLTPKGRELLPVYEQLAQWAQKHICTLQEK